MRPPKDEPVAEEREKLQGCGRAVELRARKLHRVIFVPPLCFFLLCAIYDVAVVQVTVSQ